MATNIRSLRLTGTGTVWQPLPITANNTTYSLQFVYAGTGNYTVRYSLLNPSWNDPNNPLFAGYRIYFPTGNYEADAPWVNHPVLAAMTASAVSNLAFPVAAIQLQCTSFSSGSGTLHILAGDSAK